MLKLTSDGPAIRGSIVTFTADLLEPNGTHAVVADTLKWVSDCLDIFEILNDF